MEVPSSFGPYIAPEVQPFRRFFAKFMLAVPAMITLAVAVQSKGDPDAFEFELADREVNARFEAYVPVMRQSAWVGDDVTNLTPAKTRKYAEMWAEGWEQGKLKPLPSFHFSDSVYDGVPGQIVRTQAALIFALEGTARKLIAAGNAEQGAKDALLTLRLSHVLRNSDLLLNSVLDVRIRRAMNLISQASTHLSQAQRSEMARSLTAFRTDGKELEALCSRSYSAYLRDIVASGGDPKYLDRLPRLSSLRRLTSSENPAPIVQSVRTQMGNVEVQTPKRPFETLLAHTLENEVATQSELNRMIQKLEEPAS